MEFFRTFKTIFWLFLGVRSNEGRIDDFKKTNGKTIIMFGIAIFLSFIAFIVIVYFAAKLATGV